MTNLQVFTKAELKRIIIALKKDNVQMEYDIAFKDMDSIEEELLMKKISLNNELIYKIEKGI